MRGAPHSAELEALRTRALALLRENLERVETTPRRPIDPDLLRTEADQAILNVSAAFEALYELGVLTDPDRERFFDQLRDITTATYATFRGVELERVVPAPRAVEVPGVHLLAAELYSDGVILRWLFIPPPASAKEGRFDPPQSFSLWDDVDTAYAPQGGGWVPGHHLRGDTVFVPAVPPEATRLLAAADRRRFELDLRGARGV